MIDLFYASVVVLILTIFLCLYRVVIGPGVENRLIAVNTIGTTTIIILVLIGSYTGGRSSWTSRSSMR